MSRFGFDDKPIKLPDLKTAVTRNPDGELIAEVARAGRDLGFVSRESKASTGKAPRARRRRREKRSNLLIHGPERVLERFRNYADAEDLSYWEAIERLLDQKA